MAVAKEKFSTQADPRLLRTIRRLAKAEGRQLHSLIDEALHDLIDKRTHSVPRSHVLAHYQASIEKYDLLYKRLAE
jgi:hypothetical protein